MWEHVVWVLGTVGAVALSLLVLWSAYRHGGHDVDLRERAFAGEVFLAEATYSEGSVQLCGCLEGIPVGYVVTCGDKFPGVEGREGGLLCINCARAEFRAWCLRQRCGIGDGDMHPVANGEK
jgi:hypothetical protein